MPDSLTLRALLVSYQNGVATFDTHYDEDPEEVAVSVSVPLAEWHRRGRPIYVEVTVQTPEMPTHA